uniref:Uncharacterized protein n=1 Tax=Anguilla anguilla TaxID=7936 RepID=A0A0E9PJW7_ANGAN
MCPNNKLMKNNKLKMITYNFFNYCL